MTFKMPKNLVTYTVSDMSRKSSKWITPYDVEVLQCETVAIHVNTAVYSKPSKEHTIKIYKTALGHIELDMSHLYTVEPDYIFEKSTCQSEPLIIVSDVTGIPD